MNAPFAAPAYQIQRILVGIDFSAASDHALRHAVNLAAQLKASLIILHVVPADYGLLGIGKQASRDLDEALQAQAAKDLRRFVEKEIGATFAAELQVRIGRPAEEIIAGAAEAKCNLIVVATHGYSGLDHILIGSVAERVVRTALCPVMVVRDRAPAAEGKPSGSVVLRFEHKGKKTP